MKVRSGTEKMDSKVKGAKKPEEPRVKEKEQKKSKENVEVAKEKVNEGGNK